MIAMLEPGFEVATFKGLGVESDFAVVIIRTRASGWRIWRS
jgi:hypothetical protein